MLPIRAVLFDCGDTLFHYRTDGEEFIIEAARSLGADADRETARRLWVAIHDKANSLEEWAKGRDLSAKAHRECWMDLLSAADVVAPGMASALYETLNSPASLIPFDDTVDTLQALADLGIRLGVVSNTGWDIRPLFDQYDLLSLVQAFVLSFERGVPKPDPDLFRFACTQLDVTPEETLMVGDHVLADGGAVMVGMRVFLLPELRCGGRRGLEAVLGIVARS